jgi:hypothetical protein
VKIESSAVNDVISSGTRRIKRFVKAVLPGPVRDWVLFRRHLRPTDVFIVAHPKSGNTWLAYMLAILLWKDRDGHVNLGNQGNYVPHTHHNDVAIAQYPHLPDPRIFRNEGPRYQELYPKIMYLIRDPRAVLVSLYHMYEAIVGPRRPLTFQAFLDEYLIHGCIRSWEPWQIRWDRQVTTWLRRAERDTRIMIIRYEDMVRDRQAVLARAAKFAGIRYDAEDLAVAVARGSFQAMRTNEEQHGTEIYSPEAQKRARFIRRGTPDGWKDEIEPQVLARIEEALGPAMRLAGYR